MKNLSSHTKLTEILFRQKGAVHFPPQYTQEILPPSISNKCNAFVKSSSEGFTKGIIDAINEFVKLLERAVIVALFGIPYVPIFIFMTKPTSGGEFYRGKQYRVF